VRAAAVRWLAVSPTRRPAIAQASSSQVRALSEEVQSAFAYLPATLIGMIAGVAIVLWLFHAAAPIGLWLPWLAAFAALWLLRLVMLRGYRRALRAPGMDWQQWHRIWVAATLASGALWGATGWLYYGLGNDLQKTGLVIVIYSYCIAAVPVLANHRGIFVAFVALSFAPTLTRMALVGGEESHALAGELAFIVSLTTLLVRSYGQALRRVTDLKLRADDLLAQLEVEKRVSDEARHAAEIANRAKTQFLAAASHDLRQPLHAMGLFAEALRQRVREPDAARLVNSINESVGALEGLFSELLDITRIDSGAVTPQPAPFRLDDVFRRLRLHFEPSAFEKGLALRMRGGRHVAHADPLLVERILRNLVANAIRYTDDGGVLLGCRRRGDRLRLQVWDTGVGIAAEEQSRVFEEFYQVPGRVAVTADQRKGLGLGLAIVARLATLMQAPLAMRSTQGKGTVFTLELPAGSETADPGVERPAEGLSAAPTLAGRTLIVVEDDAAVREGLEELLGAWGARVFAYSGAGALRSAHDCDTTPAPDLVITDYRLEAGSTGVDAIAWLRARYRPTLPAVVVTGSTIAGLDVEAQQHDFHVLIKPVVPTRLRAMVAFKLAAARPWSGTKTAG